MIPRLVRCFSARTWRRDHHQRFAVEDIITHHIPQSLKGYTAHLLPIPHSTPCDSDSDSVGRPKSGSQIEPLIVAFADTSSVCGILGLLLHDPLSTQTSAAGTELYADFHPFGMTR